MLTSDVCVPVMIFNLIYLQQARPLLLLLSVWYHSPLLHYSVFFCLHAILSFIHLCPAHTPSLTTSPACSYTLLLFLWAHPAPPPSLTALYSISSIWSRAISARRALICWLVLSWFTITLFLMFRARLAYFSVFSVSMKSRSDGLTQAIMTVRLREKENTEAVGKCAYDLVVMVVTRCCGNNLIK